MDATAKHFPASPAKPQLRTPPTSVRRIADEETTAEYVQTTKRHLRALRQRREIPFVRLGDKLIRYDLDEIDRWLDGHRVDARS
jgi:excisionase family DNA binding protein